MDTKAYLIPLPLSVIVAEKHPVARAALATLLSYDGCRVFQADSPKAAISLIDSVGSIAVLLADLTCRSGNQSYSMRSAGPTL